MAITSDAAGSTILYQDTGDSTNPNAELKVNSLAAGTYYVKVAADTSHCSSTGSYVLYSNATLTAYGSDTGKNSGTLVNKTVGPITNARVRVRIVKTERSGAIYPELEPSQLGLHVLQRSYGDGISQEGRLMLRCGGASSPSEFAKYLEGKTTATGRPYPYNGTPTGEALQEAENYFKQSGGINSSMFDPGKAADPITRRSMVL